MSATDMYDCTHGPRKDCHACLVKELVEALEWASAASGKAVQDAQPAGDGWFKVPPGTLARLGGMEALARAVLEKAKEMDDCIPIEEAEEASRR